MFLLDDVDGVLPFCDVVVLLDGVDGLFEPDAVVFITVLDVQGVLDVIPNLVVGVTDDLDVERMLVELL